MRSTCSKFFLSFSWPLLDLCLPAHYLHLLTFTMEWVRLSSRCGAPFTNNLISSMNSIHCRHSTFTAVACYTHEKLLSCWIMEHHCEMQPKGIAILFTTTFNSAPCTSRFLNLCPFIFHIKSGNFHFYIFHGLSCNILQRRSSTGITAEDRCFPNVICSPPSALFQSSNLKWMSRKRTTRVLSVWKSH